SIPRDTYTTIPGMPDNKINAAYGLTRKRTEDELRAKGGASDAEIERAADRAGRRALVRSVQNLTGLRVDHYAEVNLYGFYLLTQAIGGVPVCLNHPTRDKDSGANFPAGRQTISGTDALAFVRQRENLPHGDLDRIVRQQVFLASAARKVLSTGPLTDPKKLSGLVNTVEKSLTVDNRLNILSFVQQAQNLVSNDVKFVTIPVTSLNGRSPSGQSIVTVDRTQVREFVRSIVRKSPRHSTGSEGPSSGFGSGAPKQDAPSGGTVPAAVHADTPAAGDVPTPPVTVDGTRCVN
ncbi:MAG: LCP family protein, partial [Sciscionella sp.]